MTGLAKKLSAFTESDPLLMGAAELARSSGCRILLVGGAVRDIALGRPVGDLDFILDGPPRPFLPRLSRFLEHRIVTFRKRDIVDHRVRAGDREWDFVERGTRTLRREILRRDFALNAVTFDPTTREVLDPGNGRRDLSRRTIRALSSGVFRNDPLRMLRAVRLQAEIPALRIDRKTSGMIRREARLISGVSAERVKAELDRILLAPRPSDALRRLEELGLLAPMLPEMDPLRGLTQNRYHHLDAFEHSLEALAAADDPRALARGLLPLAFATDPLDPPRPRLDPERARRLRWALLLHDTGKASTRTVDDEGDVHFYLHERPSARIARQVLRRLRSSRSEIADVEKLVALHLRVSIPPAGGMTPRALRRIVRDAGDLTPLLALHSLADKLASKGPGHARVLSRLRGAGRELLRTWRLETERQRRQPRLVGGRDVMAVLSIPPGPRVGSLLAQVEELYASGELRTREQALAWLARQKGARVPPPQGR